MCCRVATCCFITDLRRATLLIAIFCLVGNACLLAFTAWCFQQYTLILLNLPDNPAPGDFLRVALAILGVMLLICVAAIILDFVLFFGALRRRQDMVQCWTNGHAVVSGAYLVYFWTVVIALFAEGVIVYGLLLLGASILGSVMTVYFWVVVHSYDLQLKPANFGTESAGYEPLSTNTSVLAPTRLRASWETDAPTTGTLH